MGLGVWAQSVKLWQNIRDIGNFRGKSEPGPRAPAECGELKS